MCIAKEGVVQKVSGYGLAAFAELRKATSAERALIEMAKFLGVQSFIHGHPGIDEGMRWK